MDQPKISVNPPKGGGAVFDIEDRDGSIDVLLNAASHLETIENGEQLWTAALAAFAEAGFSCVIYLVSGAGRDRVTLRTNIPRLYENAAPAGDPFLQYCCNNYDGTLTGPPFCRITITCPRRPGK